MHFGVFDDASCGHVMAHVFCQAYVGITSHLPRTAVIPDKRKFMGIFPFCEAAGYCPYVGLRLRVRELARHQNAQHCESDP
jgi:hypothetical protein